MDGVSVRLLTAGAAVLSLHLSYILNLSFKAGEIPECWECKCIAPIYKGTGSEMDCGNYRPISIQPIPLKVLEKVVNEQLQSYLTRLNLFSAYQSGFRKLHATATAVIDVSDYIHEKIGQGYYVGAIFLDLAKAFDCVDHGILLQKLSCYGICGTENRWFESFLNKRKQFSKLNNVKSDLLDEQPYSVPQGSVLGPLLFLLHINDLTEAINCKSHLYADDTVMIIAEKSAGILENKLNIELSKAENWLSNNKLTLNIKKTMYMIFGNKTKLNRLEELNIQIGTEKIKRTEIYKYLGVYFDSQLSWKEHVKKTCAKVGVKLRKIERALPHLTFHTKKLLINSLVMPYFSYCSEVWSSSSKTCLKRLARQFKKSQDLRGEKCDQRENSLVENIQKKIAIMTYKCLNDVTPVYLKQFFKYSADVHGCNARTAKG